MSGCSVTIIAIDRYGYVSAHVNCVEIADKNVLSIIINLPHNTNASHGTQSCLSEISSILYCTLF